MIENRAARAIIAGAVGLVVWKVLELLLVGVGWLFWWYLWAAFFVALGIAIWVFIGLAKPNTRQVVHTDD